MPSEPSTDIRAWSANDPARPEVAWSASFGLMMRWPDRTLWHYGPWGPSAEQRTRAHNSYYYRQHLPADAVLLVPDWSPAGRAPSSGVQR